MISNEIKNGIEHLKNNDKTLSKIIEIADKCNLKPRNKHFNSIVKSIINQQLSIYAAASIYKKFVNHFNNSFNAEKILCSDDLILRGLGLSNSKVKYVKDFAQKILSNEISLKNISKKSDEQIILELTKVKGIGVWTVQMFLIFNLARLNVLPTNDLGIKRAIKLNYNLKKLPDEKRIIKISQMNNWSPYNSIACWYLWISLEL